MKNLNDKKSRFPQERNRQNIFQGKRLPMEDEGRNVTQVIV